MESYHVKIITENGVNFTNIDEARNYWFNAGTRDGISKGVLNEGVFKTLESNVLYFDTCELRIGGHRFLLDQAYQYSFSSYPAVATRYALVATAVVDAVGNVTFTLGIQDAGISLVKDKLYKNLNGAGTYQVEIGRFTLTTNGTIADITRTLDVITGGSGATGEHFVAGDMTTTMLDAGMNANVTAEDEYDANGNYKKTNFNFEFPETAGTVVRVNNIEQANLDFTSDPQTQLDNKVDNEVGKGLSSNDYTTAEKTKLGGIEAEANKTIVDSALSSSSENPVQNKVVKSGLDNKADLTNASQVITLGGLKDGNNANYKAVLPDTTDWTENKILATTDHLTTRTVLWEGNANVSNVTITDIRNFKYLILYVLYGGYEWQSCVYEARFIASEIGIHQGIQICVENNTPDTYRYSNVFFHSTTLITINKNNSDWTTLVGIN